MLDMIYWVWDLLGYPAAFAASKFGTTLPSWGMLTGRIITAALLAYVICGVIWGIIKTRMPVKLSGKLIDKDEEDDTQKVKQVWKE